MRNQSIDGMFSGLFSSAPARELRDAGCSLGVADMGDGRFCFECYRPDKGIVRTGYIPSSESQEAVRENRVFIADPMKSAFDSWCATILEMFV